MKDTTLMLKILVLIIIFVFSGCQKSTAEKENILPLSVISPTQTLNPTPEPNLDSPIRKVDFENFKYPWVYQNLEGVNFSELNNNLDIDYFELKNGIKEKTEQNDGVILQKIEYGDVTGDGKEEAIFSIYPDTGGNCSCNLLYIYAYDSKKTKLLWGFGTGDRAKGGFKKAYAENGELVIELFGDNKFENDKWNYDIAEGKFTGLCCPTTFTKIRFKWNGKKFVADGNPELFDYDWKNQKNNQ